MSVVARLLVREVEDFGTHQVVKAGAVYSSDPTDPNYSFSQATPHAELTMTITNPAAFGAFVPQALRTLGVAPDLPVTPELPPGLIARASAPLARARGGVQ